jgi:hypothetical protein
MSEIEKHMPVGQPRLVRLEYEGKPWTAERLKTSSYVHFKNAANPNDGMMWAVPDENMGNLAWRIYHANYTPTREELFGMLSVIDSYRSLLTKPAKRQRTLARVLLQFILPNVKVRARPATASPLKRNRRAKRGVAPSRLVRRVSSLRGKPVHKNLQFRKRRMCCHLGRLEMKVANRLIQNQINPVRSKHSDTLRWFSSGVLEHHFRAT